MKNQVFYDKPYDISLMLTRLKQFLNSSPKIMIWHTNYFKTKEISIIYQKYVATKNLEKKQEQNLSKNSCPIKELEKKREIFAL